MRKGTLIFYVDRYVCTKRVDIAVQKKSECARLTKIEQYEFVPQYSAGDEGQLLRAFILEEGEASGTRERKHLNTSEKVKPNVLSR